MIIVEYTLKDKLWNVRIDNNGQITWLKGIPNKRIAKKSANEILSHFRKSKKIIVKR